MHQTHMGDSSLQLFIFPLPPPFPSSFVCIFSAIRTRRTIGRLSGTLSSTRSSSISIAAHASRLPSLPVGTLSPDRISSAPFDRWDADRAGQLGLDGIAIPNTRFSGWLENVALFDAAAFGVPGAEACAMDPQQRLLLESARPNLLDAGILRSQQSARAVAVYIGIQNAEYAIKNHLADIGSYSVVGADLAVAAGAR